MCVATDSPVRGVEVMHVRVLSLLGETCLFGRDLLDVDARVSKVVLNSDTHRVRVTVAMSRRLVSQPRFELYRIGGCSGGRSKNVLKPKVLPL